MNFANRWNDLIHGDITGGHHIDGRTWKWPHIPSIQRFTVPLPTWASSPLTLSRSRCCRRSESSTIDAQKVQNEKVQGAVASMGKVQELKSKSSFWTRSILHGYFNPLVFWYWWEYLLTSKEFNFCRVSKIGNVKSFDATKFGLISKGIRTAEQRCVFCRNFNTQEVRATFIEDLLKMVCYVKSQPPSSPSTQPMFNGSMPIVAGQTFGFEFSNPLISLGFAILHCWTIACSWLDPHSSWRNHISL